MKFLNSLSSKQKIATALFVFVLFVSGFTVVAGDLYFETAKNIDIFTRVYKEIVFNYVDEVSPGEFLRAGIKGMLSTLDPYTSFIDEKHQEDIELLTNGKYGGIGISIGVRESKIVILELIDGYSAQRQGIRIGDAIYQVNGINITPENFDDISTKVKGEPGTFVKVRVLRGKTPDTLSFDLVREEVIIKNVVFYDFVPNNSNNAYIKLTGFSRSAGEEVKKAISDLRTRKEIKSLVVDIRGNPGGLLEAAVEVSNKFLKKGDLIVSTKGRDSSQFRQVLAEQEPLMKDIPLSILINGNSASASEILAGAIQDHDRGIIIGTKSFGKGLVQTIMQLSYNTSMKLTSSRYYTPSGRSIQKIDYAKNNKVIARHDSVSITKYYTSHKRSVYSAGGITPDSTVENIEYSDVTNNLLAQGAMFKFANYFFELHPKLKFIEVDKEDVMKHYIDYLNSNKYEFNTVLNKEFDDYIIKIQKNKSYTEIANKMRSLKAEMAVLAKNSLTDYKAEILQEIMIELAARYNGTEGRINEMLKYDKQFGAAVDILSDLTKYHKIINN